MLNIIPPPYMYCPFCSSKLEIKTEEKTKLKWCPHCNWTYYPHVNCAVGAVIVKNGKVLLVKRNREPYKDTWMFPAGFVNFGEHPTETVKREVKEETGLTVKDMTFISLLQNPDDPRAVGHFGIFYHVEVDNDSEVQNNGRENQDVKWFNLTELPIIGWQSHQELASYLMRNK